MATITEQITQLEQENANLKELQKLFEKAIKVQYGVDAKRFKKIVENQHEFSNDFEKKIASYFSLKTDADFAKFLEIFCTESSLNYYNNHKTKENK